MHFLFMHSEYELDSGRNQLDVDLASTVTGGGTLLIGDVERQGVANVLLALAW